MALTKITSNAFAASAVDSDAVGANTITTAKIADTNVTHAKLHTDMNFTGKTLTLSDDHLSGNKIHGGVISNFASTGIDDNASSTTVTITADGGVGIGTSTVANAKLEISGGGIDIQDSGYPRVRFYVGSTFKGGVEAVQNTGSMISTSVANDLAIRSQSNMLFAAGGNTERMRINSSGNVGIGTTSPETRLDIRSATATYLTVGNTTDNTSGLDTGIVFKQIGNIGNPATIQVIGNLSPTQGSPYTAGFKFQTGDYNGSTFSTVDAMTIAASGNVGIGNNSPENALHIASSDDAQMLVQNTSTGDASIKCNRSGQTFFMGIESSDNSFRISDNGTSVGYADDRVVIKSNGLVGLNNNNPLSSLAVYHSAASAYSSTADSTSNMSGIRVTASPNQNVMTGIWFGTGGDQTGSHWTGIAGSRTNYVSDWGTRLSFYTHPTATNSASETYERMTIDPAGNVGIGTTSPAHKLEVSGTAADGTELFHITSDGDVSDGGYHWMSTEIAGSQSTNANIIHFIGKELAQRNGGYFGFHYAGDHSLDNFLTFGGYQADQLLNIKMNGNVGIGTTSPLDRLHVSGGHLLISSTGYGIKLPGAINSDGQINFHNASSSKTLLTFPLSTQTIRLKGESSLLHFQSDGTGTPEIISMHVNGNVGIGTKTPDRSLHVNGQARVKSLLTDVIKEWNITGSYSSGTSYPWTTRNEIQALGYGDGMYRFVVYSDCFNAGISHYSTFTPYESFYFTSTGSNASVSQNFAYGVSMGHAPNTSTRAIDIRLQHRFGADANYPANQTFEFIPTAALSSLSGNNGRNLRIRLFKIG